MRILHYLGTARVPHNPDADPASGVSRVALEIAAVQAARGHTVTVASSSMPPWRSTWRNVRLISLGTWCWNNATMLRPVIDLSGHLPLMQEAFRYAYDVVHCHNYGYLRFIRAGQRIMHFHSDPLFQDDRFAMTAWKSKDFAVVRRYASKVIAVSHFVGDRVREGLGPSVSVAVVPNGVNAELYSPSSQVRDVIRRQWGVAPGGVAFLYCGAIDPVKGLLTLADAFVDVASRDPTVFLVIAGSSQLWAEPRIAGYEEQLRSRLAVLAQQGRVRYMGLVGQSLMPALYQSADVVVVPSVWSEAFSMVALEAQVSGKPVLASKTGGIPELVTHEVGILVPPEDPVELAYAMRMMASDPDLRQRLGGRARVAAQHYSWERTVDAVDSVYTAGHGTPGGRPGIHIQTHAKAPARRTDA